MSTQPVPGGPTDPWGPRGARPVGLPQDYAWDLRPDAETSHA